MTPTIETLIGLAHAAPDIETYKLILRLAQKYGLDPMQIVNLETAHVDALGKGRMTEHLREDESTRLTQRFDGVHRRRDGET
jgi:hypothetical protein